MNAHRWEKERSAWLKARAGHRLGVRRRAEQLARTARQQDRLEAGVGDSAFGEVTTRNVFYRSVHREEGAANLVGWFMWTLIWMSATYVFVGLALLIGLAAYGIRWLKIPSRGRMKSWPYYAAALVSAALGVVVLLVDHLLASNGVTRVAIGSWQAWPLPGTAIFLTVYLWIQLVLGLIRAGWRVRAWGWPAVEQVERAATSAVKEVELDAIDADEQEETAQSTAPAISPIDITADDGEVLEDWMVEEAGPVYAGEQSAEGN